MEYQKKELPAKVNKIGWILTGIGLVLVILAYLIDVKRSMFDNLLILMFLASIAIGSSILVGLEYIAGAVWSTPLRRVSEFLSATLPFMLILAVPFIFGLKILFPWASASVVESSQRLMGKSPYLNAGFFWIRFIVIFTVFYLFYRVFIYNSVKQDETKDQKLTARNLKFSAAFMPVSVILLSVFAIDWLMSLAPMWYSTIFGIYFITVVVLAGLAATTYAVVTLNENGYFTPKLRKEHYYSLGALLFAFTNFWAYIAFSQFLLIWYANIPEETSWFIIRWTGDWKYISVALIFVRFAVPYAALLSQPSKMNPKRLKFISLWILFAHAFDLYWLIMPSYSNSVIFSWTEVGFLVFIIGIIILVFYSRTKKYNLMPIGDPKLQRGLDFHLY
jgi:hypothetical protein